MAVLNIEKSFLTENRSVYDFLNQSGQGLYIPLYQREYSWDSDNIEQLLEDLARGIQRIALNEVNDDTKEIRFLGTIITVVESNRNNIYPVDIQAVPSRIEKLIDGQQRVSTIALIATLLVKRLAEIKKKIKSSNPIHEQVNEICDAWFQKLSTLFSFDLGRGTPRLKPKIIRGAKDFWTRDKDVDEAYHSELSNYLGHFINAYVNNSAFPCLSKDKYGDSLLYKNGRKIELWLKKTVATAHEEQSDEFASATDILRHFQQEQLWDYDRQELIKMVNDDNITDKKSDSYILCELVQTLAVCHYLLDRCCFTIIQPTDDDWAFDMFQSLNATGTPLTAIETFKPTVVNTIDSEAGFQFKGSVSDLYFKKIEDFLSEGNTAPQKNKRTNDYLTSFFVAYDGRTISTHFSYQRKALNDVYSGLATINEKESFVKKMGNYAEFYKDWLDYDGKNNVTFPLINKASDADIASMLMLFLKSSNHKMAITMFASMYNSLKERYSQDNASELTEEDARAFTKMVKLIAGYYFLWRSAFSNAGLDTTYRDFFKNNNFSIEAVRRHIKDTLQKKDIDDFLTWKKHAEQYLKYDSTGKEILKLALIIAAHDTIPGGDDKAMIKVGRNGCSPYLSISKWLSPSLKTIEHIAPQTNKNDSWDKNLYDPNIRTYQSLGNLTLLPQDINSSVGNKGWEEKLLYYQTVAEKDPEKVKAIKEHALKLGIELNDSTVEILKGSEFNRHLESISSMTSKDVWNKEVVDKRTDAILNIIWERVSKWVFD